jgi:hypothetical protein
VFINVLFSAKIARDEESEKAREMAAVRTRERARYSTYLIPSSITRESSEKRVNATPYRYGTREFLNVCEISTKNGS